MAMYNVTIPSLIETEGYDTEEMDEPESLRNIAMGIVAFLSIAGIIGNALVLYVFSRQKQKLSSTIFILTLAGTDFITSLVTMPYTIAMELLKFKVDYDAVCKIYHLLVTTTIPFSAFVMVAIAVDRYLCIVHPFKHTMTIKRAKIIVFILAILATTLGLLCSLVYGVHGVEIYDPSKTGPDDMIYANSSEHTKWYSANTSMRLGYEAFPANGSDIYAPKIKTYNTGSCHKDGIIFGKSFFEVYQKIYSAFFGICAVIVIILYAIIYRSVLTRRRQRLQLTNRCCGFWTNTSTVEQEHETTEFTSLNHNAKKHVVNGSSPAKIREDSFRETNPKQEGNTKEGQTNNAADKDALVRPSGVSRAKLEKLRMANIKTALMLSIVALTYIIAFMPAWLIAHKVLPMNVIVFYMYFTYNVANPVIYAFLNQSFRNHLKTLFKCGS